MIHQMQQQSVNPFTKTTLVERCLVITITAATAVVAAITALQATVITTSALQVLLQVEAREY